MNCLRVCGGITLGLVIAISVGGLFGWLGYREYEARQDQLQRDLFLETGSQAALSLATISSNEADADVQRILDSSVGTFHDDFAQRAPVFIDHWPSWVLKSAGEANTRPGRNARSR